VVRRLVFRQKNSTATPRNEDHVYGKHDSVVRTVSSDWLPAFSRNIPKSVRIGSSAPLPLFRFIPNVFLGHKNSPTRPMFPLSFRLVLASHSTLTITFALIVQNLLVQFLSNMLQSKISIALLLSAATFFQVTSSIYGSRSYIPTFQRGLVNGTIAGKRRELYSGSLLSTA
jgi:hypothetical protein